MTRDDILALDPRKLEAWLENTLSETSAILQLKASDLVRLAQAWHRGDVKVHEDW